MIAGEDGEMIQCSNPGCLNGRWFHLTCVAEQNERDVHTEGDWFCDEDCEAQRSSIFCICKAIKSEPMLKCANDQCTRGQDFHISCLGLSFGEYEGNEQVLCYLCQ